MTELEASVGEHPPPYMIFVVVFLFFLTGLLGFLVCHLLKKKGYRCRTGDMDDEDEEEEKLEGDADDADEENQDTVEQILKCIIENEANMEAFNEMIGNHNVCVRHDPRLRKESIGGVPPHLHTVHSGTDHNSCHLCAQVRSKKGRRQSRTPRSKHRPGEQTVFSVGRFRVTHTDKKLHGGPNPLVGSGDQLDQSQDSEERKEGGYNLRSMFKDVRGPSEGPNGVAPSVGKRRKSLTLFGLRRGSDPVGIKVREGPCREAGGVKFTTQQQPVVLEEVLQADSPEVDPGSRSGFKPGPEKPDPPHQLVQISSSVNSPSSQSEDLAQGPGSAPEDGSKDRPGPEPGTNRTAASSLPIPSPSSGQTFKPTDKQGHVEAHDPGPLETSTPISPMPGSIPSFTPTGPTEPRPGAGFPVTQSSSPVLVLVGSGSSPPSRKASPEAANRTKLPSGHATSSQSPLPSSSFGNSASPAETPQTPSPSLPQHVMSGTSMTRGDMISNSSQRVGILKTAKPSPDPEGRAVYPPTDQPAKDELSSLSPSSSSLLSPTSPGGSRAGRVTIISPDSKRQFSVATMVEEEQSTTVTKDQKEAPSELRREPEQTVSHLEVSGAEVRPRVSSQQKDDMVEMEDIRDCKVTEEEGDIESK